MGISGRGWAMQHTKIASHAHLPWSRCKCDDSFSSVHIRGVALRCVLRGPASVSLAPTAQLALVPEPRRWLCLELKRLLFPCADGALCFASLSKHFLSAAGAA